MEKEGFVLRITPYRDQDALIQTITCDGFCTFLARGVMKMNSKNASLVTLYTHAIWDVEEGKNGYFVLKNGRILETALEAMNHLMTLCVMDAVSELILKLLDEENAALIYPYVARAFHAFYHQEGDSLTLLAILCAKSLVIAGYGMEIHHCVFCHQNKHIVSFDFFAGGYVCQTHYQTLTMKNQPASYLKAMRYLFSVPAENLLDYSLSMTDAVLILADMKQYLNQQCGIEWKGYEMLIKTLPLSK